MPTVIATGDWHLDAVTAGLRRREDIAAAVDEAAETAIALKADLFVFLGDLTDPHTSRSHWSVAKAVQTAQELSEGGVVSMWITGNHDVIEDGSGDNTLLALAHVASLVDRPRICHYGPGLTVLALPYVPVAKHYEPSEFVLGDLGCAPDEPVPDVSLVVGHLWLEGISPGSESTDMARGRSLYWPVHELKQRWPDAVLVGGHYHKRQVHNGVQIAGSLGRLTFGEQDNQPGYLVVRV
jgi:DNA repair exonuclease SbcCD nuclease subunit